MAYEFLQQIKMREILDNSRKETVSEFTNKFCPFALIKLLSYMCATDDKIGDIIDLIKDRIQLYKNMCCPKCLMGSTNCRNLTVYEMQQKYFVVRRKFNRLSKAIKASNEKNN